MSGFDNIILAHHHHGAGGNITDDEEEQGNIYVAKGTAMVTLFMCSFCLGCLPIKLSDWFKWKQQSTAAKENGYVKVFLGFGGGVLLCTTFLHLLPEVNESFEEVDPTPDIEIHYAELLMCTGFFIMYFIEECVHVYLAKKEKLTPIRRSLSIRRGSMKLDLTLMDLNRSSAVNGNGHPIHHHSHHHHNHHQPHHHSGTAVVVRGLLVVMALSIHELFEGLAVGLEHSPKAVWYMFGAISIHKFVIAFCIGMELVTSGLRRLIVAVYVFTFAVVSPIGIGLGIIVTYLESNSFTIMSVVLQGLASGTLLYIVFFEILQADKKSGLKQYFSVLVGFGIMFAITLLG
ncbi:unnamed protein product [Acanthoscelides obtectus]|uniref:Uncharacterized protein n=1 Tax=Acanthoscelides obtectus TaxID=200917 RepID=A0A9P0KH25_ACAOB|nr:unnamed protein product [Acanthoscelides obtectus]CAK1629343.1 Zinc transporter ZIP1 [Acanthoscelides obtectus]